MPYMDKTHLLISQILVEHWNYVNHLSCFFLFLFLNDYSLILVSHLLVSYAQKYK